MLIKFDRFDFNSKCVLCGEPLLYPSRVNVDEKNWISRYFTPPDNLKIYGYCGKEHVGNTPQRIKRIHEITKLPYTEKGRKLVEC